MAGIRGRSGPPGNQNAFRRWYERCVAARDIQSRDWRSASKQSPGTSQSESSCTIGRVQEAAREYAIRKSSAVGMERVAKVESLEDIIADMTETSETNNRRRADYPAPPSPSSARSDV